VVAGAVPADCGETSMDELLLSVTQCCRLISVGRTRFYELVGSGEIPIRKVGRRTLVATADLKQWAAHLPVIEAKDAGRLDREHSYRELAR
jgi:excisionase family DNA binding protein